MNHSKKAMAWSMVLSTVFLTLTGCGSGSTTSETAKPAESVKPMESAKPADSAKRGNEACRGL